MKKKEVILGVILIMIGMLGIASILTMDIPLPAEVESVLKGKFSPSEIKLLILINPAIILLVAVIVGTVLYQKVGLNVPIIEKAIGMESGNKKVTGLFKYSILGGILAGVLVSLIGLTFNPILPAEFIKLGESLKPTIAARFLYGGLTEEIIMRFGLMTLIVWMASKLFKGTKPIVYWIGIILASIFFALGHFPIAYQAVESPSAAFLIYIFIGNTIGGLIFGYLYWKKGLESAFFAHIFAHVILVLAEPILN